MYIHVDDVVVQLMVASTMFIYQSAVINFLPMPSKSHYVFNLRDFARVMRGVLLVPATHMEEPEKLVRLWVHEVYRVFSDRLTENIDKSVVLLLCIRPALSLQAAAAGQIIVIAFKIYACVCVHNKLLRSDFMNFD